MNPTPRLWGGRFRKPPDARLMKLSSAAGEHARLVPQDVAGGKAHAAELARAGLLTAQELDTILAALDAIVRDTAPSSGPAARATTRRPTTSRSICARSRARWRRCWPSC